MEAGIIPLPKLCPAPRPPPLVLDPSVLALFSIREERLRELPASHKLLIPAILRRMTLAQCAIHRNFSAAEVTTSGPHVHVDMALPSPEDTRGIDRVQVASFCAGIV